MNKLKAIEYLTKNNPVCNDCARGNLDQIRMAAGLYQVVKEIIVSDKESHSIDELDSMIKEAGKY